MSQLPLLMTKTVNTFEKYEVGDRVEVRRHAERTWQEGIVEEVLANSYTVVKVNEGHCADQCSTTIRKLPPAPPPHVQSWIDFLTTVEVRGPVPITFSVLQDRLGVWILRSEMRVPDRDSVPPCANCGRPLGDQLVTIQNDLPGPDDKMPRELVIRQRVLGHYQHEALESLLIAGKRVFDPHEAHWHSKLVANWRFTP